MNPSNMSNEDLEKDMAAKKHQPNEEGLHQDNANTSEDPEVKPMEPKTMEMGVDYEEDKEQDFDDLVHERAKINHNGNAPDPEEIKFREGQ